MMEVSALTSLFPAQYHEELFRYSGTDLIFKKTAPVLGADAKRDKNGAGVKAEDRDLYIIVLGVYHSDLSTFIKSYHHILCQGKVSRKRRRIITKQQEEVSMRFVNSCSHFSGSSVLELRSTTGKQHCRYC